MNSAYMLDLRKLRECFGAEICGLDLREVNESRLYPEIRSAFEEHSLLLFRNLDLDEATHRDLAEL